MPIIRLSEPKKTFICEVSVDHLIDACPVVYLQYTATTATTTVYTFHFPKDTFVIDDLDYHQDVSLIYCGKERLREIPIKLGDKPCTYTENFFRCILEKNRIKNKDIVWKLSQNEFVKESDTWENNNDCHDEIEIIKRGKITIIYDHYLAENKLLINIYNPEGIKITSQSLGNQVAFLVSHVCWSLEARNPDVNDYSSLKECYAKDDINRLANLLSQSTMLDEDWFDAIKKLMNNNGCGILTTYLKDHGNKGYYSIIKHGQYEVYRYPNLAQTPQPEDIYCIYNGNIGYLARYLTEKLVDPNCIQHPITDVLSALGLGLPMIIPDAPNHPYTYYRKK